MSTDESNPKESGSKTTARISKPLFTDILGTKKPIVNKKFDTRVFTSHRKDANVRTMDKIVLKRKCSRAVAGNLIATEAGMEIIHEKMDRARERGKNSTNIYEVDLYERVLLLAEIVTVVNESTGEEESQTADEFYNIRREDIERGFMNYVDNNGVQKNLEIDKDTGVSIIDLIKGPRDDKYWMKRNKVLTIPEILQNGFNSRCHADIQDTILEHLNSLSNKTEQTTEQTTEPELYTIESFSTVEWKHRIDKFIEETGYIIPRIYYHYNHNWNRSRNREQNEKPGKFAIELDWSGTPPERHSGIPAGHIPKRGPRQNFNRNAVRDGPGPRPRRRYSNRERGRDQRVQDE